jgi:cytochrome P450
MLFRYDDVVSVLRDPALSADDARATPTLRDQVLEAIGGEGVRPRATNLASMDGPDHARIRRLAGTVFTPRAVDSFRPTIARIINAALDAIDPAYPWDLIADFAFPVPFAVVSALLGVPESDRDQIRTWADAVVRMLDPMPLPDDIVSASNASHTFADYLRALIADKRAHPGDDFLCALIEARDGDEALSEDELLDIAALLIVAGHETTVNLIGNGVHALLRHPDQWARVRDSPSILDTAVDELLRYDSPSHFARRVVLQDLALGGESIPEGSTVVAVLGSANRDSDRWGATAEELDVSRDARGHVAFGAGAHRCLGSWLALVEGHMAIGELVRRFPTLALAGEPKWNGRLNLRGLASVEVHAS